MKNLTGQEVDVERLMHRIRAEVASPASDEHIRPLEHAIHQSIPRIDSGAYSTHSIPLPKDLKAPAAISLVIPDEDSDLSLFNYQPEADGHHFLENLLSYDDREFIQVAYLTLLKRAPDAGGFDTYLRLLRSGATKLEILKILQDSEEGRAAAVGIVGLPVRLFLAKLCGWPMIGPLARLLTSLWNLPRVEYQQRVLDGRLFSLRDRASRRATTSYAITKRALQDLETTNRQIIDYVGSKPGYDDVQHSIDAVQLSLEGLQREKANVEQLVQFNSRLLETARALDTLQSGKADKSSLHEIRELLTHLQATRAERNEIVGLTNQLATKAEVAEVALLQTRLVETSRAMDALEFRKADQSIVDETRVLLTLALEAKAEKREITALTNHLVSLVQTRLRREDINPIEESCAQIIQQAANDRSAFEDAIEGLAAALATIREDTTAGRQMLMHLRSHYDAIESAHKQFRESTGATLDGLGKTLLVLSENKVDRTALDTRQAELRISLERSLAEAEKRLVDSVQNLNTKLKVLDQSKITRDAAHASIADAEARMDTAKNGLDEILRVLIQDKADRVAVEAAQADVRTSIDGLRAETDQRFGTAVHRLREQLDFLAQSKIDRDALQAASTTSLEVARRQAQEALRLALAPIEAQTGDIKRSLLDQERRLGMFLDEARKRLPKPLSTTQLANLVAEEDHLLDGMYASFEDIFRGTREDIKNRARIYLPYIRAAKVDLGSAPVIDLGCGRGEWLELLRDEKICSCGIDINRVFLDACRTADLDVKESDAVTFLRRLKPNSVAVVTSFHLIEHLPLRAVIALLDESLRVLKPGGLIILETPNPENLEVGACNFYTDPTHRNPLPPALTGALVELRGFVRPVIVRRDQEAIRKHVPPLVSVDQPMARSINPIVELMRAHFYVSPDYAVVATKA